MPALRAFVARSLARSNEAARPRLEAAFRLALIALLLIEVAAQFAAQPWLYDPTAIGTDPSNYYAAGLRLNDGHALYGPLVASDRPVPLYPPYFEAPLLSPPTIAVVWRALALLPGRLVMLAWWAVAGLLMVGVTVWLILAGSRLQTRLILGFLAGYPAMALITGWSTSWISAFPGIPDSAVSGNVNAYLIALLALVWWGFASNRPWIAGPAAAIAASIKVFPIILLPWFFVTGNASAGRAFIVASGILLVITLAGAGIPNTVDYLSIMRTTGLAGSTPLSLPGVAEGLGLSPRAAATLIPIALAAALVAAFSLRHRPAASFAAVMIGMVASSPVVHQGTLALYLTALIPFTPGLSPRARTRAVPQQIA
jgi:hypothetical protein